MSLAELKQQVDTLSPEQQLELAAYLRQRARESDPVWQHELSKRIDESLQGKGHSHAELLALHDRLSSEGR